MKLISLRDMYKNTYFKKMTHVTFGFIIQIPSRFFHLNSFALSSLIIDREKRAPAFSLSRSFSVTSQKRDSTMLLQILIIWMVVSDRHGARCFTLRCMPLCAEKKEK